MIFRQIPAGPTVTLPEVNVIGLAQVPVPVDELETGALEERAMDELEIGVLDEVATDELERIALELMDPPLQVVVVHQYVSFALLLIHCGDGTRAGFMV